MRDHGIGIAAADHGRIFDRFARAVSAENYGGLGLGLWIVRVYIDAMGGSSSSRILSYVLAFDLIYLPCWVIFGFCESPLVAPARDKAF